MIWCLLGKKPISTKQCITKTNHDQDLWLHNVLHTPAGTVDTGLTGDFWLARAHWNNMAQLSRGAKYSNPPQINGLVRLVRRVNTKFTDNLPTFPIMKSFWSLLEVVFNMFIRTSDLKIHTVRPCFREIAVLYLMWPQHQLACEGLYMGSLVDSESISEPKPLYRHWLHINPTLVHWINV